MRKENVKTSHLLHLSTIADFKISDQPWVKFQSAGWVNIQSAPTVMQACTPLDAVQGIAGIQPGARLLMRAEGEQQVQSVLPQINAIEMLGIDPAAVSPAYWRTLGNRLSARLSLPPYSAERHTAYLAGEVLR